MEMPSFLPDTWKPWWSRLVKWTPLTVAIVVGIGALLTALHQIATFFGLVGEKEAHLEIRRIIPVIYSSYEREGDVLLAIYVKKTGQKTAINCRIHAHADGRPLIAVSTSYGDAFSLPAGELERQASISVTPFEPDSRGPKYNRGWKKVGLSVICDGGVASQEEDVTTDSLRSQNFYKKKKD